MASIESGAVAKLYRAWKSAPAKDEPIYDQRQWDVLTSEPGGVDYLEPDLGGVPAMWAVPKGSAEDRVLLCVHGGGFISGSIYSHRKMFAHLAKEAGVRALIVGYPLLPEGVHPVPRDSVFTAYRWLLDQGVAAEHIAVVADSAGASPAIGAQLRARDEGLPLPAATLPISPWVDMEVVGGTMVTNAKTEALFTQPWIGEMATNFLDGTDPKDPYANALYADLAGFGPFFIQVGGAEVLVDDSRRLAERVRQAGGEALLEVVEDQQHTFTMMAGRAPEADEAIRRLADWVRPRLGL